MGRLSMVTPVTYFDLIETFSQPGCVVCNLLLRNVDRSLDALLYEYVNDPDTHRAFRSRRGLCNEHSWQLARHTGHALGIAILYEAAVDEVLKAMDQVPLGIDPQSGLGRLLGSAGKPNASSLADRLEPTGACRICELLADSEKQYLHILGDYLGDDRMLEAFRCSDGLCLPHFRQILRRTRNPVDLQQLIAIQTSIWSKLRAELSEYRDKSDYRRISEGMGAEGNSWLRAIGRLAGEKGVFGVDLRSAE
jgi:hypothetical protein